MSVKMVEEVSAEVPAEDFEALEEKVYRTIELYKAAKEARATAERDAKRLRSNSKSARKKTNPCAASWCNCARIAKTYERGWKKCWARWTA